ncbi:hypothetical protein MMC13_003504 [Lambiella insularis]|nr:hypothetical protein [Lambiella insularis]
MRKARSFITPRLPPISELAEPPSPASPNFSHSPTTSLITDQPPLPSPLRNLTPSATSPLLPSSRTPTPRHSSLPQKLFGMLCVRLGRSSTSPPASPPASASTSISPPPRLHERLPLPPTYHSFPPPTFTTRGQPRALDSRLDPSLLRSDSSSASSIDTSTTAPPSASPSSPPNPLALRGGASSNAQNPRSALPDNASLPASTWWFAGGRGKAPTAGTYRAWRERERERIVGENKERGKEGRAGRGFWREVKWVLGRGRRAKGSGGSGEGVKEPVGEEAAEGGAAEGDAEEGTAEGAAAEGGAAEGNAEGGAAEGAAAEGATEAG